MDEQRRRLVEDLNDAIEGELRVDRAAIAAYSTDASLFEIAPLAVAFPRRTRDVEILAAYSADNDIPLIARGAGSGHESDCFNFRRPSSRPARRHAGKSQCAVTRTGSILRS